jgi:squalene cyclase
VNYAVNKNQLKNLGGNIMQPLELIKPCMIQAIDYLISMQKRDGSWHEYCLPIVGESDQWVTAFSALGVLKASQMLGYQKGINAAYHAAEFLESSRIYWLGNPNDEEVDESDHTEYAIYLLKRLMPNAKGLSFGWGYNKIAGIDADSTAHAMRLFQELGLALDQGAEDCLLMHYDGNGAFKTYYVDSEWGSSHPDVTASAGLALSSNSLQRIRESLLRYCYSIRMSDGTWPNYWWRNNLYGTYYMMELLEKLGINISLDLSIASVKVQSWFDLAWYIGIQSFQKHDISSYDQNLQILMQNQNESGSWSGSASLRMTAPECREPWVVCKGEYYIDSNGIITTASVLKVLFRLIS